jgi:tetratricopeptide (TPR) repeat protein
MTRLLSLLALSIAIAIAPLAMAAPHETANIARARAKHANALYAAGKFLEASVIFEDAYTVLPDPGLLYNAAQAARLGGDLQRALTLYSSYVSFHPDGEHFAGAQENVDKLQAQLHAQELAARPKPAAAAPPPSAPPTVGQTADQAAINADDKPKDRPITKRWWFWVAVVGGVAVVATGVTLAVVLTRPAPSWTNTPNVGPGSTTPTLLKINF